MSDYLAWCEKIKVLNDLTTGVDLPGTWLNSANSVKVVDFDGQQIVQKIISPERPYVPRIKALGEVAYALLDYHLSPKGRVTPNVYASAPAVLWRQFLEGQVGELWRESLFGQTRELELADALIINHIQNSPSAERIALLDMIFLCQDRSGRNWLKSDHQFWALDNSMFWSFKGRFADKKTIRTGQVRHLQHPIESLIYNTAPEFEFRNGVFSALWAGGKLSGKLASYLATIDWKQYLFELGRLVCAPLRYPFEIIDDWRFLQLRRRAEWILDKARFPGTGDIKVWQSLIDRPPNGQNVWKRAWEWEIRHLETV